MSQKMKQAHFCLHIEKLYLKKKMKVKILHLGRISALHHVNHVKDLKKKNPLHTTASIDRF